MTIGINQTNPRGMLMNSEDIQRRFGIRIDFDHLGAGVVLCDQEYRYAVDHHYWDKCRQNSAMMEKLMYDFMKHKEEYMRKRSKQMSALAMDPGSIKSQYIIDPYQAGKTVRDPYPLTSDGTIAKTTPPQKKPNKKLLLCEDV